MSRKGTSRNIVVRRRTEQRLLLIGILFFLLPSAWLNAQLSEEFSLVAQSKHLELYIGDESTQIIVKDLRSEKEWRSNPVLAESDKSLSDFWKNVLQSPIILSLVDVDRELTGIITFNVYQGEGKVRVSYSGTNILMDTDGSFEVELKTDGIVVLYRMNVHVLKGYTANHREDLYGAVQWKVEYLLGDNFLDVRIPEKGLLEEGDFAFASIKVLPYLGANSDSGEGYFLIPDGSGTLINFMDRNIEQGVNLQFPIYGKDEFVFLPDRRAIGSFLPEDLADFLRAARVTEKIVNLPLFGMIQQGHGMLGIVTAGATDALINVASRGFTMDYNCIGVEFVIRKPYKVFLSRKEFMTRYYRNAIRGDRCVRYVFTPGPHSTYADLASLYRNYLIAEQGLKRITDSSRMDIRLFCGISKKKLFSTEFVQMTSFSQAGEIIDVLANTGVEDINVTLVGWNPGGYNASLPRKLPPDRRLGGTSSLKEFIVHAHGLNIPIYLETDYLLAIRGNSGFSSRKDVIREANRLPVTDNYGTFLLVPSQSVKLAKEELPTFLDLGIDGLTLRSFGEVLLSHFYGKDIFFSREETATYWTGILESLTENGMSVTSFGSNAFLLPYIDRIINMPLESLTFIIGSESIPFYQIAIHGLVSYYTKPINLFSDKQQILRMIEYGALPSYELTYENSVKLKDTTYNFLFTSTYNEWIESVKDLYDRVIKRTGHLHMQFITGHRKIEEGVYKTVYEDGTRVIVNYNKRDVTYEGHQIGAENYLVIRQ